MLIPKLLWPHSVYEICSTTVDAIEAKINKFTRRWLGVPPGLTDVAMYFRKAKLRFPLKSILEEYKCDKARLLSISKDFEDSVVKTIQSTIKAGRKWKIVETVDEAKECLKIKEVIGQTQTDRKGLGSSTAKWWSKAARKKKRDMVINEIRFNKDSRRVQKATQQPQQGQWTSCDNALQKSFTWNEIWHIAPLWISFLIKSVYDLLLSNANLVRWEEKRTPLVRYAKAGRPQENVLSSCKMVLSQERHTWRHNRVLQELDG